MSRMILDSGSSHIFIGFQFVKVDNQLASWINHYIYIFYCLDELLGRNDTKNKIS